MVAEKTRRKIVDCFMRLVGEEPWEAVTMQALAEAAGVKPSTLRAAYDSRIAVLEDFFRRIDAQVLDAVDPDMAGEPASDRLFDVLMSRLDAYEPHRAALRALVREAWGNPLLAAELNRISLTSQSWMLTAAGIDASGLGGLAKAQGLVIAFARVVGVWLDDEDPGKARTMAALDRELQRGATVLSRLDKAGRRASAALGAVRRMAREARKRRTSGTRQSDDDGAETAV